MEPYYRAFAELQSDRQIGMATGPIPWTSIVQWVRMRGIYDVEEINDFIDLIRDMEAVQREFEDKDNQ